MRQPNDISYRKLNEATRDFACFHLLNKLRSVPVRRIVKYVRHLTKWCCDWTVQKMRILKKMEYRFNKEYF